MLVVLLADERIEGAMDGGGFDLFRLSNNPLLFKFPNILSRISIFKRQAKQFYFDVILSTVSCPVCKERLKMCAESECVCSCGVRIDPTIEFQISPCCQARLVRKTFHYACSRCNNRVQSRFLFDERIFDKTYFRDLMRECRERKKRKQEEIRRLLAESRSGVLPLLEEPDLDSIPGLIIDLDNFIQSEQVQRVYMDTGDIFNMENYRTHILKGLGWNPIHFTQITPLNHDSRKDKVWRFITLVFMENDREIEIQQMQNDLLIQRVYNEAFGSLKGPFRAFTATFSSKGLEHRP